MPVVRVSFASTNLDATTNSLQTAASALFACTGYESKTGRGDCGSYGTLSVESGYVERAAAARAARTLARPHIARPPPVVTAL